MNIDLTEEEWRMICLALHRDADQQATTAAVAVAPISAFRTAIRVAGSDVGKHLAEIVSLADEAHRRSITLRALQERIERNLIDVERVRQDSSSEPEPCPFCRSRMIGTRNATDVNGGGEREAYCIACGGCGPTAPSDRQAVARWNFRPNRSPNA